MQYGCIGEHLTHSFSKEIHGQLQDYLYELKEIPKGELEAFMTQHNFRAINVTLPYKQDVIPYLNEVEPTAAAIGAVNTVVNRDGRLYGYNTDFGGMADLIRRTGIDLTGRKVLILGTGGTSKTAMAVAQHLGAACVWKVSRSPKSGALTYEEVLQHHLDAQVLINTTPRGMFAQESGMPMDPTLFPDLCGAIDAVYNPLRTEFIRKARTMGVPAEGGLYMLVRQAVLASEIFLGTKYPDHITEEVFAKIRSGKENIVLTGMPGSGKSTVGKLLAAELGRPYLDTDSLIEEKTGITPGEIIAAQGEPAFRDIEAAAIREIASCTGSVISTGGGAVLRSENMDLLRANGRIFFLDRPVQQLIPTADRPLSSTRDAILKRYQERYPIYLATADVTVENSGTPEAAAQWVKKEFLK
jgi:shikimate dehydrogenase